MTTRRERLKNVERSMPVLSKPQAKRNVFYPKIATNAKGAFLSVYLCVIRGTNQGLEFFSADYADDRGFGKDF